MLYTVLLAAGIVLSFLSGVNWSVLVSHPQEPRAVLNIVLTTAGTGLS